MQKGKNISKVKTELKLPSPLTLVCWSTDKSKSSIVPMPWILWCYIRSFVSRCVLVWI